MLTVLLNLILSVVAMTGPGDVLYVTDGTERGVPEIVLYHESEGDSAFRCTLIVPVQCYTEKF